jgi:hypothetical protein
MENISWTDRVRSDEVLQSVKEERDILIYNKCRTGYRHWSHTVQELP